MIVNGKELKLASKNILELLNELKIDNKLIAVEVNLEVIPSANWQDFVLKDSDKIEIINAVGGG
jgi:thiamine biosynthesis protein ThiS